MFYEIISKLEEQILNNIEYRNLFNNYLKLKNDNKEINFNSIELQKINKYVISLNITKSFKSNDSISLIKNLIELFEFNFEKFATFLKSNNIIIDFSDELGMQFINTFYNLKRLTLDDSFDNLKQKYKEHLKNKNENNGKINKLSDIFLVRKTNGLPENDKVIAAAKSNYYDFDTSFSMEGKDYHIQTKIPLGKPTTHWMMNQEVLPHKDAPEGWVDKNTIILQPMNETLYKNALGLEPVDTIFLSETPLQDYYIICDSKERAELAKKTNPGATIIVFSKDKINNSGNMILQCLDRGIFYKNHNGASLDGSINYADAFEPSFLEKYPDFTTRLQRGPGNVYHDLYANVSIMFRINSQIDFITSLLNEEDSLDTTYEKIFNVIDNDRGPYSTLHKTNKKLSELFVPIGDPLIDSFLNDITSLEIENLDFEAAFELLLKDINLTEENIPAITRIKSYLIEGYTNIYKNDAKEYNINSRYNRFINQLLLMRKIITSNVINKKIDNNLEFNIPLEFYDFSELQRVFQDAIDQNINVMATLENYDVSKHIFLPISKPTPCMFQNLVKEILDISKLKESDEKNIKISELTQNLGMTPDLEPFIRDIINSIKQDNISSINQIARLIAIKMTYNPSYNIEQGYTL